MRKAEALRDFLIDMCLDRRWSLLALEFKLFAIRHPEVKTRLAAMNRRFVSSRVQVLQDVRPRLAGPAHPMPWEFRSRWPSLVLEHMLDRTVMSEQDVEKIIGTFFDSLTASATEP